MFQLAIFMRTDIYALFVVATGCRNLWGTKGAVARRAIRRATSDDLALLATVDRREIRWATLYLILYLPGVAWTAWYFAVLALPAVGKLIAMSAEAIASHGLLSPLGGPGALALTIGSTGFIVWGVVRTIGQLTTRISARP